MGCELSYEEKGAETDGTKKDEQKKIKVEWGEGKSGRSERRKHIAGGRASWKKPPPCRKN